MNSPMIGSKAFKEFINFQNIEASASIPVGTPILFAMNGTADGYAAHLPSSSSAAKSPELFAGIANGPTAIVAGQSGGAQVWGLCEYALVVQQSRAASTDVYASAAALSIGQALAIDTVNNALKTSSQVTGAFTIVTNATTDTLAVNFGDGNPPMFVMGQTLAAATSSASTTSDTSVKKTYGVKIFLRAL